MNTVSNIIGKVCIILVLGVSLGWCLVSAMPHPLICQVWSFQKGDWKTIRCYPSDPSLSGAFATEKPTATEYEWYTATPTEWEPAPFVTMTPTEKPYPPQETQDAYP